ncbi:integrase catalytic domain-containing protein [Trichonephila clavipes]|nr:integrase catalytic domain-containing protein [Trichonephila clavipes]
MPPSGEELGVKITSGASYPPIWCRTKKRHQLPGKELGLQCHLLTPMSSDPNDFAVLTPGHFLIGRPLQSLPGPDMTDKLDSHLSQWQKLTKFVQFIWRKWRLDYLNNLQARHKWQFEKENVTPNSMVTLKDENLSPCKWTMGRILEIVKGSDGKVRVVKVKTPQVAVNASLVRPNSQAAQLNRPK